MPSHAGDGKQRDAVEKARQMQVTDDQHHREQQHDGGEVDVAQRVAGAEDAEGEHQHSADNRHAGAVNFPAGKFADGEHQIAGEEDQVSGDDVRFREGVVHGEVSVSSFSFSLRTARRARAAILAGI